MGLTAQSTGKGAIDQVFSIQKENSNDKIIALAGNPNVGKSTVFNHLTGLNQHTGNWPGKTVALAQGRCQYKDHSFTVVDLPGTYSLLAHSAEEEVARDFLCFNPCDAVVVVCDATCLERNLNLVLQTLEVTQQVVVCVNLLDEAKKKHIKIDLAKLEELLGVPVIGTDARKGVGLEELMEQIDAVSTRKRETKPLRISYLKAIEEAVELLEPAVISLLGPAVCPRWLSLRLLEEDPSLTRNLKAWFSLSKEREEQLKESLNRAKEKLMAGGITSDNLPDKYTACLVLTAEAICNDCVFFKRCNYNRLDRKLDRFLTSRSTGIPVMLLLLCLIFWITIAGANYPSQLLGDALFALGDKLNGLLADLNAPRWLQGALIDGVYRVLAWVISVMLPPMSIFFPLFTLLEDLGYLPRVAFNLDKYFKNARTCGKQALTMCMA